MDEKVIIDIIELLDLIVDKSNLNEDDEICMKIESLKGRINIGERV